MEYTGLAESGNQIGRTLGFPTLNLKMKEPLNKKGVFAVKGEIRGLVFSGIAHIGPRPTFSEKENRVEIHVFDFQENIPEGTPVRFSIIGDKIRGIKKFSSREDLSQQIKKDCIAARIILDKDRE